MPLLQSIHDLMQYDPPDDLPRSPLVSQRLLAAVVAAGVLAAALLVAAQVGFTDTAPGTPPTQIRGAALGVVVEVPGRAPQRFAVAQPIAGTRAAAEQVQASYALPRDGSLLRAGRIWSTANVDERSTSARARSDVGSLELLGGRIKLSGLSLRVSAAVADGRARGGFALAPGARLVVDGTVTRLTANKVVLLDGVGSVTLNEQAVVAAAPTGDAQTGPRYRLVAALAHVRLAQAAGGLPPGTQIVVGRVEAGVRQGKVRAVNHPPANPTQVSNAVVPLAGSGGVVPRTLQAGSPKPGEATLPRQGVAVRAAGGASAGNMQGYVFPVLGLASFSNDWGAPRQHTGSHQGNDIFAAEGTPLVAVADGVLDRVGWNSVGGYRLWLHDRHGNGFYYAHLSAFSPLAIDGARVRAGDVVGFMGHTGDAQGTPDHVHFEVHPGNVGPTNPFPYLTAWKRGVPMAIGAILGGAGGIAGDRLPALSLLEVKDPSAHSGLADPMAAALAGSTRPVADEGTPVPTDDSLRAAIDGAGIH